MTPDIILHGGPILTLDPMLPRAAALVIRNNRIAYAGDESGAIEIALPGYESIDLRGRTAMPGLTDAHIHLLGAALVATQVNLEGAHSYESALEAVRQHAAGLPADAWVLGYGWDQSRWGRDWPGAADLDAVTGGRPAYLTRKDLHSAWANSAALRAAGISGGAADPEGGSIGRDANGEPNGMLFENAVLLIASRLPEVSQAVKETAIGDLTRRFQRAGITSVHAPEGQDCFAAVQALYQRGELGARVLYHLRLSMLDQALEMGVRSGLGDPWVRIGGVKIFSDGSLGSCTAHMLDPFNNLPPEVKQPRGLAMHSAEALQSIIDRAINGGISVTVHAIGDAANQNVLNAIEATFRKHPEPVKTSAPPPPGRTLPHSALIPNRIEHAQVLHPDDILRFARLGVVASVQPIHAMGDIEIAERFWGERCATAYAWKSLLDAGAILAFGSDAPVETWSPWAGIHAAVTRQRPGGSPDGGWYPDQRLTLEEALWGYTVGPAVASGELPFKGTLTAGKLADVIVLDRDIQAADPAELHGVGTDLTLLNGVVVWERE